MVRHNETMNTSKMFGDQHFLSMKFTKPAF